MGLDGAHPVDPVIAEEAACDCEVVDLRPGPGRGALTREIPPRTRRAVAHRDGYRCAVPACTNHVWLHLHHLQFRENGGDHSESNLALVCTAHHRLIHAGTLTLRRGEDGDLQVERAPERLPSELGSALLELLRFTALELEAVAQLLGTDRREALGVLAWYERRGLVFRTPGGLWLGAESQGAAA